MPKYLIKASYTAEGARGIAKEGGTSRRDTIDKLAQNSGGTMESFYFAFGDDDAYVTCDLPDNATAAAVALAVNSSGAAQVRPLERAWTTALRARSPAPLGGAGASRVGGRRVSGPAPLPAKDSGVPAPGLNS